MEASEIKVGETYRCRAGWIRRVSKIRPDRFVEYESWRPNHRDAPPSKSTGHINWFSVSAIEVDRQTGPVSNGDRA